MPLLEPEPTENGPASQHCKMLLGFDVTSGLTSKEMLPPLCHTFSRVVEPEPKKIIVPDPGEVNSQEKKLILNFLVRSGICSSIEPIKSAKCPIIKLQDKETGINVDISFNRENGIYCV